MIEPMKEELPRLDKNKAVKDELLKHCRLKPGQIWEDRASGHRVGCLDAGDAINVAELMNGRKAALSIQDPPYNLAVFEKKSVGEYITWCEKWIETYKGLGNARSGPYN